MLNYQRVCHIFRTSIHLVVSIHLLSIDLHICSFSLSVYPFDYLSTIHLFMSFHPYEHIYHVNTMAHDVHILHARKVEIYRRRNKELYNYNTFWI